MRKHWLVLVQVAFSAFLLWRIFGDASLRAEASSLLGLAHPFWLASGLLIAFTGEFLCAIRWWIMLRIFGVPVSFARTCAFTASGLFFSLGLPGSGGGDAFRILYVIRIHPNHKLRATLSVIADRLCGLVALALTLIVPLFRLEEFKLDPVAWNIFLISSLLVLGVLALVFLWWLTTVPSLHRRWLPYLPHQLREKAAKMGQIFGGLGKNPRTVSLAILLAIIALAAHFTTYFCSARAFALPLSLADFFAIMPLVDTLTMLPVTLYGLGLRETLFEYLLGGVFHIPAGAATMASLTGFGLQAVVALLGGLCVPFTTPAAIKA